MDCHPLVREHFGQKLKETNPKGCRQAHGRLYEYYKGLPEKLYGKFLPDTLEEMEPLFCAVSHGCQARRHQDAHDDVYLKRIRRANEYYVVNQLGAFGSFLGVVSAFFEKTWSKPVHKLREGDQAVILNNAGMALRALARLTEAVEPMKAGMQVQAQGEDWQNAASAAGNLSELYLTLGQVNDAVDYGRKSMEYSDRMGHTMEKVLDLTVLADALKQKGRLAEAKEFFVKAEQMQKKYQPDYPYLYLVQGFRFCDLLLSAGQYKDVEKRILRLSQWRLPFDSLLGIALENLSAGCAYLLEGVGEKSDDYTKAGDFLDQAVDGLRESGNQDDIPRGLLARAELHRYQRRWEKAWADLEEAKEIAERGQMNLFLADYHLEAARLCLAQGGRLGQVREHCEEAAKRVKDMGYHRRDPEVLLIQAELEFAEGKKAAAKKTLKAAERRIDKMGCHRWDIEVERLQGKLVDV